MNKIIITGGLGRDSELKQVGDKSVLEFSVAVNSGYKKEDPPSWWRCTIWGTRAEKLHQYLTKGTRLLIEGEPKIRQYEDKEGNKKLSAEIFVKELEFFGSRADNKSEGREENNTDPGDDYVPF